MSEMTDIVAASAGGIFGDGGAWPQISDAGLHRLLLPEDQGGMGEAFEEAVAVAMQVGLHAVTAPLLETVVANWCLVKAGLTVDDQPCWLLFGDDIGAQLKNGRLLCTQPLIAPADITRAVVVVGSDIAVLDGLSGGVGGMSLHGVPQRRISPPSEGFALADLASLPAGTLAPLYILALLKSAAIAGAAEAVLNLTVEYANTRKQFGRAIGQFQAIQHMTAQLSGDVVAAAASVQHAARVLSGEHRSTHGPWAVAVAKGFASEAAGAVAAIAHQVHGAIGFTEEFVLQRYTKCLWMWREDTGDEAAWYARLGQAALRDEKTGVWPAIVDGAPL